MIYKLTHGHRMWKTKCEALAKTKSLNWADPNGPKRL
jgi:hypothetical protein